MRVAFSLLFAATAVSTSAAEPAARWWKGNLHTHSLWSDGNDFPEMIAAWYKDQGWNFLALSDHNVLSDHELWIKTSKAGPAAMEKYLARWGEPWVERRMESGDEAVRLKTLAEFRVKLEEPWRFLMVQSEEITAPTVHVCATNIQEKILPYTANTNDSAGVRPPAEKARDPSTARRPTPPPPPFPTASHAAFRSG